MPRVNYVKHARALYHTKPVIDPETGEQKVVPVFKKDGTTPKTDKRGRQVMRRLTVRDLDRPKPNLRCDFPGCDIADGEIQPGMSYKFLALRFGQRNRHAEHPNWQHWEYSSSVAAQAARVQHDMHNEIDSWTPESVDEFDDMRDSLQQQAQDFADERQEALDNMPEALQDGSVAQEYAEAAESWAQEFDSISAPDEEFEDCDECDGTGYVMAECESCDSTGEVIEDSGEAVQCDECGGTAEIEEDCQSCDGGKTDVLSEDWLEGARDALREAVDAAGF